MSKYIRRRPLTPIQEAEVIPMLDSAITLPFGKAIVHVCAKTRADYLSRILNGERHRNAILSLSTYSPGEPLYAKGLYYHLVIEPTAKGLLIANVENPPESITSKIIECAATRRPVALGEFSIKAVSLRLLKLKQRYLEELGNVYLNGTFLDCANPTEEELIVVDIDVNPAGAMPCPTKEDMAKLKQ